MLNRVETDSDYVPGPEDRLALEDIPTEVLIAVWRKWEPIQKWNPDLWKGCAMCRFMEQFFENQVIPDCDGCEDECNECEADALYDALYAAKCQFCVLGIDDWCTGYVDSQIYKYYNHLDSESEWLERKNRFVGMFEDEMFRR